MPNTPMTFQFLDIGMGDGTLAIMGTGEDTQLALIDLGVQPFTKFKVGRDDARKYLTETIAKISMEQRELPVPTLDHLFLTHPDGDHYNCVQALIDEDYGVYYDEYKGKKLKIGRVTYGGQITGYKSLITDLKKDRSTTVDELGDNFRSTITDGTVAAMATFAKGGVKVYLLSANYPKKSSADTNAQSLCLMFHNGGHKMIFMGDAEGSVEAEIIRGFSTASSGFLNCSGLKMGHHGSLAGTTEDWLKAVKPKAVFASGDFVWAHPYCPAIQRAVDSGFVLRRTVDHRFCCGVSGKEYFNHDEKFQVFLNLWYVVKDPEGEYMKSTDPEEDSTVFAEQGTTYGVQWALDFNADDTVDVYSTFTANPVP